MAQEQSRLQKLGRQRMPGWLALKVPPKLPKLAECNAPVGAIRSLVQCHIVDNSIEVDAAQRAMQEYKQAEDKRQAKMQKLLGSRDALRHRIHNHLQQQAAALQEIDSKEKQQLAKQERLQRFNQHVEELKISLRQENAKKALKQAEDRRKVLLDKAGCASGIFPEASSSRPPLVTRHAPNHQLPAQPSLDQQQPGLHHQGSQIWGVTSCDILDSLSSRAASATPQVLKARVLDAKQTALEKKVKEKHITLPPLCSCPHECLLRFLHRASCGNGHNGLSTESIPAAVSGGCSRASSLVIKSHVVPTDVEPTDQADDATRIFSWLWRPCCAVSFGCVVLLLTTTPLCYAQDAPATSGLPDTEGVPPGAPVPTFVSLSPVPGESLAQGLPRSAPAPAAASTPAPPAVPTLDTSCVINLAGAPGGTSLASASVVCQGPGVPVPLLGSASLAAYSSNFQGITFTQDMNPDDDGLVLSFADLPGNVAVQDSQFTSLPDFVIVSNSTVRFSNVTFSQCNTNGPGAMDIKNGAAVSIQNSTFVDNSGARGGAIVVEGNSGFIIQGASTGLAG
ncbi:hypothetical protein WJX77_005850 [Trebouxia sp. C0004]